MIANLKNIVFQLISFLLLALGSLKINAAFWFEDWNADKNNQDLMSNITYNRLYLIIFVWVIFNLFNIISKWKEPGKKINLLIVPLISFASLKILTTNFANKYTNFLMLIIDNKSVSFVLSGLILIIIGILILLKNKRSS